MWKHRSIVCGAAAVLAVVSSCSRGGGEAKRASGAPAIAAETQSFEQDRSSNPQGGVARESRARHLAAPSVDGWRPRFPARGDKPSRSEYSHLAVITDLEVPLYSRPGSRWPIGLAAIGNRIPARPASGSGCSGGSWYQVTGNAYLCSGAGVEVRERPFEARLLDDHARTRVARLDRPIPYRHGKAVEGGPPELSRLPTAAELARLRAGERVSGLVRRSLAGVYFLALAREVEVGDEVLWETVEGRFLRAEDIELTPAPQIIGERFEDEPELPLAFVYRETELHCLGGKAARRCGTVDLFARFPVHRLDDADGRSLVFIDDETAVDRDDVRLVERIARPRGVSRNGKWIHIHLDEQILVAYEGDRPVYATLVTSGRTGFETPPGTFQVERVYATKTMRGKGEHGPYEVQKVPWALYYHGNYAVHGAYWHSGFGRTRSHGCVNVPPMDARWLYHWAVPDLPFGWSAMFHRRGTHVHITGKTPPDEPDA